MLSFEKVTLEQERFDRLFGSLGRINVAFGEAFGELSVDGMADLRFSREPLTLFKVDLSMRHLIKEFEEEKEFEITNFYFLFRANSCYLRVKFRLRDEISY
jgi:hypothetical protein